MVHMSEFRPGMWVMTDQGVGIFSKERDGSRTVHLIAADGSTICAIPFGLMAGVRQAKADEIPASRVEHLDEQRLARLGYV